MTTEPPTDEMQALHMKGRKWERKLSMDTPQQGGGGRDLVGLTVLKFREAAMSVIYRVSSSVKVTQMEAELSHQLSALRTEIEENGFPQRAVSSKCYRCACSLYPVSDNSSITPTVRWAQM